MKPTGLKRIQNKLWTGSLFRAVGELLGQEFLWNLPNQGNLIILNGPTTLVKTCLECRDKAMLKITPLIIRENLSQRFPILLKQVILIQWLGAQTEMKLLKTNTSPIGQGNDPRQARLIIMNSPNQASARAICKQMVRIWYSTSTYSRIRVLRNDQLHPSLLIMKKRRSLSDSKRNKRKEQRTMTWLVLKAKGKERIQVAHSQQVVRIWFNKNKGNLIALNSEMQETKNLGMKRSEEWPRLNKFYLTRIERSRLLPQAQALIQVQKQFKSSR